MIDKEEVLKFIQEQFPYGHRDFYVYLLNHMDLHNRKNRDYATQDDPLANFKRVGEWGKKYKLLTPGFEATKVGVLYMLKQVDASLKLLGDNTEGQVEGITERLDDVAVYATLIKILYNDEKPKPLSEGVMIGTDECMAGEWKPIK